jgi:hypothetical protein
MNTFPIHPDTSGALITPVRRDNPGILSLCRYGETGTSEKVQLEDDRTWFPIAAARRPRLKASVYVVARVRAVDPAMTVGALVQIAGLTWQAAAPSTSPSRHTGPARFGTVEYVQTGIRIGQNDGRSLSVRLIGETVGGRR